VWYEEYVLISYLELLECGFVVDECHDYLSVLSNIGLFDEDEVTTLDSLLVHGVTICSEEEVLLVRSDYLGGYWYLSFDVFLGEYRHPAGDSTDERDIAYRDRVGLK
jgi:hypothetical protein